MSGLKRYFHEKRGRGLISAEGVQLLDHACSAAVDQSLQRLNIWTSIEKYAVFIYFIGFLYFLGGRGRIDCSLSS